MGNPKGTKAAKLFMSLIASEESILQQGVEDFRLSFGEIDLISARFPFRFTDYYAKEMGDHSSATSSLLRSLSPSPCFQRSRGRRTVLKRNMRPQREIGGSISIQGISVWSTSSWPPQKVIRIDRIFEKASMLT